VVLVVGIVAAVLLLGGDDPEPQVTLPQPQVQETTQGTAANPTLDQLLAYAPPEATNCTEATPAEAYGGAIEAVVCESVAEPRAELAFFLYPSPEVAASTYLTIRQTDNIEADTGDCSVGEIGESSWSGGGGSGRLVCGLSGEQPALMWTSDAYPVIGQVTARTTELTIQDIYNVWLGISDYSAV
jgi:hypothetical protein